MYTRETTGPVTAPAITPIAPPVAALIQMLRLAFWIPAIVSPMLSRTVWPAETLRSGPGIGSWLPSRDG
jgi:hypothetical protein